MITETFAVITAENDDGLVVEIALVEIGEKAPDDGVRGGDLTVVRARRVAGAERLDRLVRRVRLEEVKKEKKRSGTNAVDPAEGRAGGDVATPLQSAEGCRLPHFHRVVVEIKQRT